MRKSVKVFRCSFLYLFFYVICIGYNMLYASSTEEISTIEIPKWSLEFNDCSVSDALGQISKFTGVNVFTNKGVGKMILKKYYKDKTIDYMVTDILSRENYAMIRRFNDKKKLVSIGIWILDWSRGNSIATNNPFEASRIERNVKNGDKNNPFEVNRTEGNVKGGDKKNPFGASRTGGNVKTDNKNNPFTTQGESKVFSTTSSKRNINPE